MFKLTIPIIKTSKLANGRLVVEGVASDPTIDSDNEKFAPEAIKHMKELLNKERIPIRMEHEDKIYTNIGEWMEADIDEKNMLKVKGEIDTELSLGKDIEVLANRGEAISLSVGGNVLQAGYEYSKDLGKNIKIYKDVLLKEISIVKNPANSNTSLSLAKSVDWKAVEKSKKMAYTTEAQKMISFYKSMEQVTPEKFIALEKGRDTLSNKKVKKGVKNSWEELTIKPLIPFFKEPIEDGLMPVEKDYDDDSPFMVPGLTEIDMQVIIQVSKFLNEVDIPETMERPPEFDDYDFMETLPEEAYIIMANRRLTLPHHNVDLSLNKTFLAYTLKRLFGGKESYFSPKEYSIAVNHLYHHLKQEAMLKYKTPKQDKDSISKKLGLSDGELNLLKSAYEFKEGTSIIRPKIGENALDEATIEKCAEAYNKLIKSPNFLQIMSKEKDSKKGVVEKEEEASTEEVISEDKKPTDAEETSTDEAKAEDAKPEDGEATEDAPKDEDADDSAKDADESEKSEDSEDDSSDEDKEKSEDKEDDSKNKDVKEAEDTEETAPEAPEDASEKASKIVEVDFTKVEKKLEVTFQKTFDKVTKVLEDHTEKIDKMVTKEDMKELGKIIKSQGEIIKKVSETSLGRKSIASKDAYVTVEKTMKEGSEGTADFEKAVQTLIDGGASFKEAYAQVKTEALR